MATGFAMPSAVTSLCETRLSVRMTAISFHPSLTGGSRIGWPISAAVASAAGYGAMDIVLDEIAGHDPAAVRAVLDDAGITAGPASLPLEFRLDEDSFRRGLEALPALAELAAAIGVKTMFRSIPASSHTPAEQLRPTLVRRVSACATVLHEHGIDFAIEVLGPLQRRREAPHEFIWRLADGARFARACPSNVGLLVDSWHWHHAGGTVRDIVDLGANILHVHVADAADIPADEVRDDQRLLPGSGVVNHQGFYGALAAAGYSRFISPEVRGYRCDSSPVECARAALHAVGGQLSGGAAGSC
jgi:sugar phosphate isomerase/epimerase